jgi:hypothetical protein
MRRRRFRNQRLSNYQHEYDKIKGILDHVITPPGLNQEYYNNEKIFKNHAITRIRILITI